MVEQEKLSVMIPIIRQQLHRKLGMWASSSLSDDLYFLREAVTIFMSDIGDGPLKEHYKENYDDVIKKFNRLGVRLEKVKIYHDSIKDKSMEEKDKEAEIKKIYFKALSKIPLMDKLLYDMLMVYIKKSSVQYQKIPNEDFKHFEREYKIINYKKELRDSAEEKKDED